MVHAKHLQLFWLANPWKNFVCNVHLSHIYSQAVDVRHSSTDVLECLQYRKLTDNDNDIDYHKSPSYCSWVTCALSTASAMLSGSSWRFQLKSPSHQCAKCFFRSPAEMRTKVKFLWTGIREPLKVNKFLLLPALDKRYRIKIQKKNMSASLQSQPVIKPRACQMRLRRLSRPYNLPIAVVVVNVSCFMFSLLVPLAMSIYDGNWAKKENERNIDETGASCESTLVKWRRRGNKFGWRSRLSTCRRCFRWKWIKTCCFIFNLFTSLNTESPPRRWKDWLANVDRCFDCFTSPNGLFYGLFNDSSEIVPRWLGIDIAPQPIPIVKTTFHFISTTLT